jgi:hypothetical protein
MHLVYNHDESKSEDRSACYRNTEHDQIMMLRRYAWRAKAEEDL